VWQGIELRPGAPCDNYRGYCDVFRKCRSVDSNGPLSKLRDFLLNVQTYSNFMVCRHCARGYGSVLLYMPAGVDGGELVGGRARLHGVGAPHGALHQVLRRAHALHQSEQTARAQHLRDVEASQHAHALEAEEAESAEVR